MEDSSKFKEHMQRSVIKRIIAIIVIGAALYILGLFLVTYTTNEINTANNLEKVKEKFISLYKHNEGYLLSDATMQLCQETLLKKDDTMAYYNA